MSSKKEEERNEKIIRGLMKLPPNRRCINCDNLGPQYVCTNFWTFICINCSGVHREFTHRVKSVSMAKFTTQEVEALQRGGNQNAREIYLKGWETLVKLPNSSNADKIREFIKKVYVDKKYVGESPSDKQPNDLHSHKNHQDYKRASSYHSFSQSPPYEHQYEDRRYGKQTATLSRKPGSDRGHYEGKISSFVNSPGHLGGHAYEGRFSDESVDSRISDHSVSSTGGPFRLDDRSPDSHDIGYKTPRLPQERDISVEDSRKQTLNAYSEANVKRIFDGIPRPQRTVSSSSFGSQDGTNATNSCSLIDIVIQTQHDSATQIAETSAFPSSNQDLFNLPTVGQAPTYFSPPTDMFAGINNQILSTIPSKQKILPVPVSDNVGWATFDLPHHVGPDSEKNKVLPVMFPHPEEAPKDDSFAISYVHDGINSICHGPSSTMADQWHASINGLKKPADELNSQPWNAFDDSFGNVSQNSLGSLLHNTEAEVLAPIENSFRKSVVDDNTCNLSLPFSGVTGTSVPTSVLSMKGGITEERKTTNPFDLPYDLDLEANNVFLGMNSLEEALPNPWLPHAFLDVLTEGELAYITGQLQSPQLPAMRSQGPVASVNPFA